MKKSISILLVLIMVSSCFALASCNWSEIFNGTTTTTEKRIPPSERDPLLDELELDYTDNFNEYDIEFIKYMRSVQNQMPGYDEKPSFSWAMKKMSRETDTFYKVNVNLDNEPYFIAVYGVEENDFGLFTVEYGGVVEWLKWCKFDNYENIPDSIGNWTLIGSYAVYDCVVEKDIINSITYNHSCKYYVPLTDGYSKTDSENTYGLNKTVIWSDVDKIFGRSTPITIMHSLNFLYFYGKDIYKYDIDENEVEYLVLGDDRYPILSIVDQYWKK